MTAVSFGDIYGNIVAQGFQGFGDNGHSVLEEAFDTLVLTGHAAIIGRTHKGPVCALIVALLQDNVNEKA